MGKKKKPSALSHEEIWDDSALVRSWDDAVEEYQTYHSIHARGENVEEALERAENEGLSEVAEGETMDTAGQDGGGTERAASEQSQAGVLNKGVPPNMPDSVLGQVQDPALKNLMMAWYYAGYYTGLHEGRQQASQSAHTNK
ncbi:hypothetical protein BGW36DRAFT_427235 [Talaromyces proteolyticus]|uniref:Survival Motor Neuron Gemin2-binding domain-containing protein n=1 Tax=Talaromyces proteolyticus TaxID=1131652 RepID=A0AAD4KVW5_9EURO|nr:uncharacterized protein BGW36DRAFT_427235 [Talaromyces proteolyticus]KAH8697269.1 hypothetical protein BGW36DRAFT_427235 [Talaromyces proteolyticus]